MTKNVNHRSNTWSKMKGALAAITEASSSYGGSYMGPSYSMDISSGKQGFSKRIDDLVKISEKAKRLIAEKDTDGVVSFNYHDDRTTATNLQVNLVKLERYSSNVSRYLKEKIDQPFYEEMDKVGARLEALSIRSYTTSNTVGFKRTEYVPDATGMQFVSQEVTPETISLSDLYKVDSPYKTALEKSYEQFRNSDAYKDNKLSKDDYLMAMHHTRSFVYDSIDDQKERIEMWRDLALTAGVIILTIFCPPAGAAAGVVLAGADMYSAAVGKDWGTGRELDNTERVLRGVFSLFDLIPGVAYLNDLAKTGKKAGLAAVKASIKEGISEGLEQGAKNLDNFKGLLTKAKGFGDDVLKNVDNYAKQLDNLAKSKLSSVADNVAGKLRQADEVVSDVARRFSLNDGLEFQLVSGAMPSSGPGKLSGLADNLSAFAKNLDGSLDEVLEGGGKLGDDIGSQIFRNGEQFDEFGNLKPNVTYQTGEFEYIYKTNDQGVIVEWNADKLHLTDRKDRLQHNPNTPGKIRGQDHAGHLAGDRFGGSPELDNLVSQLRGVNLSDYKKLENQWAEAINAGKEVSVNVKINYIDDVLRPDSFDINFTIDGMPFMRHIMN